MLDTVYLAKAGHARGSGFNYMFIVLYVHAMSTERVGIEGYGIFLLVALYYGN